MPDMPSSPARLASAEASCAAKGPPPAGPRGSSDLRGAKILVVEDDASSRKLLTVLLKVAGARVSSVECAEDALAIAALEPLDLAIVDLVLPRIGGLALVEELRKRPETKHIALIAVSSLSSLETERLARAAGCAAFVRKPIDTETFVATVAACLGGMR